MLENLDWRFVLAITATIFSVVGFIPYFIDLFSKKTKPHIYTWLVWTITVGTAASVSIHGGGKFGSIPMIVGAFLVFVVAILAFRYGTKNITLSDTISFIFALLAIVVWWQLQNPLLAVIMVSLIDGLGYVPTFRKTYQDPYSETTSFWVVSSVSAGMIMFANNEYNLLTMTYAATVLVANALVASMIYLRRRHVTNNNV